MLISLSRITLHDDKSRTVTKSGTLIKHTFGSNNVRVVLKILLLKAHAS